MKKQYYIMVAIVVILIIVAIGIFLFIRKENNQPNKADNNAENITENSQGEDNNSNEEYNVAEAKVLEVTQEEMENMKKEINAIGDTSIYQVEEELGGRKILQIKPSVQFEVDLAGVIKNTRPEENEIKDLTSKVLTENGVWISEQSRDEFLNLLKDNGIENFEITQEGYLKKVSDNESLLNKQLEKMINSNKLYIINMTGIAYERDYISGEIVEYPFEDMDPTQIIEPYRNENTIILEVTTNKRNKLTSKEILETIVQY